jgi:hypothetical protein
MLGISIDTDLYIDYALKDIHIESFRVYLWRDIWLRAK